MDIEKILRALELTARVIEGLNGLGLKVDGKIDLKDLLALAHPTA